MDYGVPTPLSMGMGPGRLPEAAGEDGLVEIVVKARKSAIGHHAIPWKSPLTNVFHSG